MRRNIFLLLALFGMFAIICSAQQSLPINPPIPIVRDLITPVNIKPLTIDDMARKRGLSNENPAKNVIILFGSGFVRETASIFRAIPLRKPEINEMENIQLVLPTICQLQEKPQIDLISFLTGDGRSAGIVSDTEFACSSACDFLRMKPAELFDRVKMALTLADFVSEEQRAKLVKDFAGKNIEFASSRRDLDRLFTGNAEKIIGCFKRNSVVTESLQDFSQPYFDELVTASLSRLSVEPNGFILLIGAKGAAKARENGRFSDMVDHLRVQEKVLHQINYFVSGRKDTLVIVVEDSNAGFYKLGTKFKLKEFAKAASELNQLARQLIAEPKDLEKVQIKIPYLSIIDSNLLSKMIAKKDIQGLSSSLQKALAEYFTLSFVETDKQPGQSGFTLFSRGVGAEVLGGLVTYNDFIRRISLITGINLEK